LRFCSRFLLPLCGVVHNKESASVKGIIWDALPGVTLSDAVKKGDALQRGTPGFSPPEGGNNIPLHRRLSDRGVVPCHRLSFDYYMLSATLLSVLLRKHYNSGPKR